MFSSIEIDFGFPVFFLARAKVIVHKGLLWQTYYLDIDLVLSRQLYPAEMTKSWMNLKRKIKKEMANLTLVSKYQNLKK